MCEYQGHEFGSTRYPDSLCIDGWLWDADSYDDSMVTSGGDDPCPICNGRAHLMHVIDWVNNDIELYPEVSAQETITRASDPNTTLWEDAVRRFIALHEKSGRRDSAIAILAEVGPIDIIGARTGTDHRWPWVMNGLSAHEVMRIQAGG